MSKAVKRIERNCPCQSKMIHRTVKEVLVDEAGNSQELSSYSSSYHCQDCGSQCWILTLDESGKVIDRSF